MGEAPVTVERRVNTTLKTPLFEFSTPEVPGCEVSLQTYTSNSGVAQWEIAFGIGGGAAGTILTSLRATFMAGAGEHKRVFLPVQAILHADSSTRSVTTATGGSASYVHQCSL